MRKLHKVMACCMIGTLAYVGSSGAIAQASEQPVAGIDALLHAYFENDNSYIEIKNLLEANTQLKGLSFARVSDYVNIRSKANTDSQILGKLYKNSAATILEQEGEWCKVKSGSVTGYIKSEFLITGDEAEELAKKVGTTIAKVNTGGLRVRKEAGTDAPILTLLESGKELIVKDEQEDWIKVAVGGSTGYVSADFVELRTEYKEAVSIKEEQDRLRAEAAEREARERAEAESSRNRTSSYSTSKSSKTLSLKSTSKVETTSAGSSDTSSLRNNIVSYALQFEGNPYRYGGTSLTNGIDCSAFTQAVYRKYGVSIPRDSRSQAASGRTISIDNVRPGDLIFYRKNGRINHVALYIGNGKVISASSPATGIRITRYNYRQPYKAVRYLN